GRANLAATTVAMGQKAVFGGGGGSAAVFGDVDIYDASTQTWSTAQLSQARNALAAAGGLFACGRSLSGSKGTGTDVVDFGYCPSGQKFSLTDGTCSVPRGTLHASANSRVGFL